jgi:hypothetical protein
MKAMIRLKKTERKREICMRDIGVAIGISLNQASLENCRTLVSW